MPPGTEFFNARSFARRLVKHEVSLRDTSLALLRTAQGLAFTSQIYGELKWADVTGRNADVLVGPQIAHRWGKRILSIMNIRTEVHGSLPRGNPRTPGETSRGTLLVCNHRSYLDVPMVASQLETFMIGNAAVKSWPIFGRGGELAGIIYLDRSSRDSRKGIQRIVDEALDKGYTVLNFPEGANFAGPGLAPFKPGLFHLLAGRAVDLVPMTLTYPPEAGAEWVDKHPEHLSNSGESEGSRISLLEHVIRLLSGPPITVKVCFGEPIDCATFPDVTALIEATREKMLEQLTRMEGGVS